MVGGGGVCASHGESLQLVQRATADCELFLLLAPLCAREPVESALWPKARLRSFCMSMLRLTLELSGASMRRTPTVVVEATGACASLLTGLLPPVLEAHAADDALHGGQFGRRQYIGHGRNRAGQPAVCRRLLRNGAFRHHPPSHPHLNAGVNRRFGVLFVLCIPFVLK